MNDKTPIRVLHIAPGDLWAGAEVQLYNLACGLNELHDAAVSVVLLNHGTLERKLIEAGIEVIIIDEQVLGSLDILRRLTQLIRELQPDVIHTQRSKINIFGCIAAYASGRIPSLRTAHGSQEHPPGWKQLTKRLTLFLEWLCDCFVQQKVIAVSKNLAGILEKNFPPGKICIIENGINSSQLINDLQGIKSTSENGVLNVGIAGRLVPIKRIDLFIKAAHYFKEHHTDLNVKFHVYGDGPLRDELEALNVELQTKDIVSFEGHCDNMPQKLKTLDALLMTSDHEGLPMILLEAMTLETAIIAHAVGGITDLLNQGECGMLVEEHTSTAYAKALYKLLSDDSIRHDITQKAVERVTADYSAKSNAQSHLTLYRDILSS